MGTVANLMGKIDAGVATMTKDSFEAVGQALDPFLLILGAIFIVLYAYSVMNDRHNFSFWDFIFQLVKVLIIVNLFRSWAFFNDIYQILSNGGAVLGGKLLQAGTDSGADIYTQFDSLVDFVLNIATTAGSKGGAFNLMPAIIGAIVGLIAAILAAICVAVLAVAKIGLGICIAVAPLIMLTLYFKGTSGFFEKWVAWGMTFAVVPIIVAGIMGLVIVAAQAEGAAAGSGVTSTIGDAIGILTIILSAIYFLWQVPSYAGQLAGGAALTGFGAAVGRGAKGAASTARGAAMATGAGAGLVASKATAAAGAVKSTAGASALIKTAAVATRVQGIATKGSAAGLHHNHPRRK